MYDVRSDELPPHESMLGAFGVYTTEHVIGFLNRADGIINEGYGITSDGQELETTEPTSSLPSSARTSPLCKMLEFNPSPTTLRVVKDHIPNIPPI
tara:strand:+ start:3532 stop:3819 length:288 start_codon:yes stop_codon:yes gene_type:complete